MVTRPGNRVARISPLIPGVDLVGTVLASDGPLGGRRATGHRPRLRPGCGPPRRVLPAGPGPCRRGWSPCPRASSARQAATIGTAGFTAALSLHRLEHHGLSPGDGPVLVTGASGRGRQHGRLAVGGPRATEVVASTGKIVRTGLPRRPGRRRGDRSRRPGSAPERTLGPERWAGAVDCVGGATLTARAPDPALRSRRGGQRADRRAAPSSRRSIRSSCATSP